MPLFRVYDYLGAWIRRHLLWVIVVVLSACAAGLGTDRFVGGRIAYVAGNVQFIFLVLYFFLTVVLLLFQPYRGRLASLVHSKTMRFLSATLCTIAAVIAVALIWHTLDRMVSGAS